MSVIQHHEILTDLTDMSSDVPIELHVSKQWVYSLIELRGFKTEKPLSFREPSLALIIGSSKTSSLVKKCSVQRSNAIKPERCLDYETLIPNVETSINFNFGRCKDRCPSLARSRWFASARRFDFRVESIRHNLVSEFRRLRFKGGPYKNSPERRSDINSLSKSLGPMCSKEDESLLQIG